MRQRSEQYFLCGFVAANKIPHCAKDGPFDEEVAFLPARASGAA
jgi:hypothetical protein